MIKRTALVFLFLLELAMLGNTAGLYSVGVARTGGRYGQYRGVGVSWRPNKTDDWESYSQAFWCPAWFGRNPKGDRLLGYWYVESRDRDGKLLLKIKNLPEC